MSRNDLATFFNKIIRDMRKAEYVDVDSHFLPCYMALDDESEEEN